MIEALTALLLDLRRQLWRTVDDFQQLLLQKLPPEVANRVKTYYKYSGWIARAVGVLGVLVVLLWVVAIFILVGSTVLYILLYNWQIPFTTHQYDLFLDLRNQSHCVTSMTVLDRSLRGSWYSTNDLERTLSPILMPGIQYDFRLDVDLVLGGTVEPRDKAYHTVQVEAFTQLQSGSHLAPASCEIIEDYNNVISNSLKTKATHSFSSPRFSDPLTVDDNFVKTSSTQKTGTTSSFSSPSSGPQHQCNTEDRKACFEEDQTGPTQLSDSSDSETSKRKDSISTDANIIIGYDYSSTIATLETLPWMEFWMENIFVFPNIFGWFIGQSNIMALLRGV